VSSRPLILLGFLLACSKPAAAPPVPQVVVAPAPAAPAAPTPAQVAQQAATLAVAASRTDGFVVVPAGSFTMGAPTAELEDGTFNDAPQHAVTLTRAFEIQATEVTQAQFQALAGKLLPVQDTHCPECPVVGVSWAEAAGYCNSLSRQKNLPQCHTFDGQGGATSPGPTCRGYRLPTEAEWEYAARAGSTAARHGELDAIAWVDVNSGVGDALVVHPVAKKQPNAWGVYDMLGNVFEWTADWEAPMAPGPATDPLGPLVGKNRVFRGGSFKTPATEARAAFRNGYGPGNQVEFIGFRCVRSL
jgi:sulfatase modifying factor 1